ncbi:MAG: ABC-F family ATP-binding cassette domain-containing protein [Myxococcaceae bacterium]|nr:ABC-F family ATP-binding cassette domain-containing protein [Myxococcaceae bacterium]
MSLLIVQEMSLSYGKKTLFDGAAFTVGPTDRIGLVGANGTGKSTLLKILVGQVKPDRATVTFRRKSRVGYLPQDLSALPEGRLLDTVLRAVPGRDELEERLKSSEAALAEAKGETEQMEWAQVIADLHDEREHFDEHFGAHRAESILAGLGFSQHDFQRATDVFSGGWRMRAALAGLLLQDPDLLLLDEPTNHLDLPTLSWFDAFLKRSKRALMLISHDRDFLNRQIDKVISLELEGVKTWSGNYDTYQRLRAEEAEQLLARAQRQEARRAELEAFINRFRAKASKARQVQSRIKQLDKEERVSLTQDRDTVSFRFPEVARSGREVVTFKGIDKAFGANVVYRGLDSALLRGQRVAVVGVNGAGKTTLLKMLAGELEPDAGSISLGHGVVMGYYAQHHAETLDKASTILEEMMALVPDKPQSFVRGVLGAFLFTGDDVEKRIGVLSGGERARVALAKLLLKPANLLVMDEPTNHLDLDSSEALIDALDGYGGTLIFVSHNRSFLNQLATHVWDVRDQRLVEWPGNLDDYLRHLELDAQAAVASPASGGDAPKVSTDKERKRKEAQARAAKSTVVGPLKKEIATIEARVATLEEEQKVRGEQLADPAFYGDFAKARPVMDAHRDAKEELERLYQRWEEAQQALLDAQG